MSFLFRPLLNNGRIPGGQSCSYWPAFACFWPRLWQYAPYFSPPHQELIWRAWRRWSSEYAHPPPISITSPKYLFYVQWSRAAPSPQSQRTSFIHVLAWNHFEQRSSPTRGGRNAAIFFCQGRRSPWQWPHPQNEVLCGYFLLRMSSWKYVRFLFSPMLPNGNPLCPSPHTRTPTHNRMHKTQRMNTQCNTINEYTMNTRTNTRLRETETFSALKKVLPSCNMGLLHSFCDLKRLDCHWMRCPVHTSKRCRNATSSALSFSWWAGSSLTLVQNLIKPLSENDDDDDGVSISERDPISFEICGIVVYYDRRKILSEYGLLCFAFVVVFKNFVELRCLSKVKYRIWDHIFCLCVCLFFWTG